MRCERQIFGTPISSLLTFQTIEAPLPPESPVTDAGKEVAEPVLNVHYYIQFKSSESVGHHTYLHICYQYWLHFMVRRSIKLLLGRLGPFEQALGHVSSASWLD